MGMSHSTVNIVAVGRLVPEKGYDQLLHAVAKLDFPFNLYVIGGGILENELKAIADRLNISHCVHFIGQIKKPFPFMRIADVSVISSILEGFPNILHEMMYLSKALVSTQCADGIDAIPGIITCEPNNIPSLAHSISDAVKMSEDVLSIECSKRIEYLNSLSVSSYYGRLVE